MKQVDRGFHITVREAIAPARKANASTMATADAKVPAAPENPTTTPIQLRIKNRSANANMAAPFLRYVNLLRTTLEL